MIFTGSDGYGKVSGMKPIRTLSDTDVYRHLTELANELDTLSQQCVSVAGETAIKVCAVQLRTLSMAFLTGMGTYKPKTGEGPVDQLWGQHLPPPDKDKPN